MIHTLQTGKIPSEKNVNELKIYSNDYNKLYNELSKNTLIFIQDKYTDDIIDQISELCEALIKTSKSIYTYNDITPTTIPPKDIITEMKPIKKDSSNK